MKKLLFILVTVCVIIAGALTVNADTGSERRWFFMDEEFSGLPTSLSGDVTVNGLTLSKGLRVLDASKRIRGISLKKQVNTLDNGSKTNGYIKFYVNGNTDIHILAGLDSETGNGPARNITVYSESNNQTVNIAVQKINDYKYEYRGGAGYVYIYTAGGYLRLFGITAKDYSADEYAPIGDNEKKEWDFNNYCTMGKLSTNKDIDGLSVYATSSCTVELNSSIIYSYYGDVRNGYINLSGTGKYEGRFIKFSVPRNSDIYITARSGDGVSDRNLIVRNPYYGMPDTDIEKTSGISDYIDDTCLTVSGELNTQKISYYGNGEDFELYSSDSAIRIYKITIVPRVNKITASKTWDISKNSYFSAGSYENTVIDNLSLYKASVQNYNGTGYTKRLAIKSDINSKAGKLKFNISDSSGTRGEAVKRTVHIKANTELAGTLLVLLNSEDYLIGCAELSTDIKDYAFDYTGTYDEISICTYYPGNLHGGYSYFYSIDNGTAEITGPNDTQRTVSVTAGNTYQYYFTGENINADKLTYKITYNENALTPKYIGYGDGTDKYSSDGINIIKNSGGEIIYTIDKSYTKWTGVTVSVIFEAKSTGNTTIGFLAEINK